MRVRQTFGQVILLIMELFLDMTNIPGDLSSKLFSQMAYIDEDNDLKFINTDNNLVNNSLQDVYTVWKKETFHFVENELLYWII